MMKQKKPRRGPTHRKKPSALKIAERTIEMLAMRHHTTPDMVRKHIQVAMMNGLISSDPQTREAWYKIPSVGDTPTPEEVIAYFSSGITGYEVK